MPCVGYGVEVNLTVLNLAEEFFLDHGFFPSLGRRAGQNN